MNRAALQAALANRAAPDPLSLPDPDEVAPGSLPPMTRAEAESLARRVGLPRDPRDLGYHLFGVVVLVTPDLAYRWLSENNTHNRNLIEGNAQKLKSDNISGRWRLTHQGIAFRRDGRLQDGQHRLYAILESMVPALLLVALNIDDLAQEAIDSHRARQPHDVANIAGLRIERNDVALIRRAVCGINESKGSWSNQEAITWAQFHEEAINFARRACRTGASSVQAPILRAWYHEDLDRLEDFGSIFDHGTKRDGTIAPEDQAAVALARLVGRADPSLGPKSPTRGFRDRTSSSRVYAVTTRALVAFLAREGRKVLHPITEEVWTLQAPPQLGATS